MAAMVGPHPLGADLVAGELEDVEDPEGHVPAATGEAEEAGVVDLAGPEALVDEEVVAVPAADRLHALAVAGGEQLLVEGPDLGGVGQRARAASRSGGGWRPAPGWRGRRRRRRPPRSRSARSRSDPSLRGPCRPLGVAVRRGTQYHEGMTVPRQGKSSETGRVNQKRRTRAAIVEAAQELLQQGVTPTVAQAAEAALVSRTTAYRYFPTQESLLVELSREPRRRRHRGAGRRARRRRRRRSTAPSTCSTASTATCAPRSGSTAPPSASTRTCGSRPSTAGTTPRSCARAAGVAGWRRRWRPSPTRCRRADLERLIRALSLVTGPEAMIVLYDVCHIAGDDALAVSRWAAAGAARGDLRRGGGLGRARSRRRGLRVGLDGREALGAEELGDRDGAGDEAQEP